MAECPYCDQHHEARYLCDPAAKMLDAIRARGASFTMPTIELPAPVPAAELGMRLGLDPDDRVLQQLVAMAGTIPVAGVTRPVLILTGRTPDGPLGRWVYPGTPDEIEGAARLVTRMSRLAIRTARGTRG